MKVFDWLFGPGKDGGSVYERRGLLDVDQGAEPQARHGAGDRGEFIEMNTGRMGDAGRAPDRAGTFARLLGIGGECGA